VRSARRTASSNPTIFAQRRTFIADPLRRDRRAASPHFVAGWFETGASGATSRLPSPVGKSPTPLPAWARLPRRIGPKTLNGLTSTPQNRRRPRNHWLAKKRD
jgi:hypothetical protein